MRFFVGQVGFCCNLDTARADGVFCELITWGRNVQQSCGSPKAALVWDVARWKCIKVWGTPFVTLGLGLLYVYFYFPISKLHCFLQIKGHIKMFLLT